jgi:DNA-binding transcriptional LysR family regulator
MGIEDMELSRVGLHRRIAMRCQQFFAACQVVTRTDLLLTMPEQYAYSANQNLPNKIFPLPIEISPLDMYLYWHENVDVDPANIWFRELLVSIAGEDERP